jgi:hypothetical protein
MPPQDTEEWGLPDGADDECTDDEGNEVPSVHRQEQGFLGGPTAR